MKRPVWNVWTLIGTMGFLSAGLFLLSRQIEREIGLLLVTGAIALAGVTERKRE